MNYAVFKNLISDKFKSYIGIVLSEKQCHKFFMYMNLLIERNKVMNLTAITEPEEIVVRHFLDSSMPVKFYEKDLSSENYIVDIGTGAGFPGLPLAILCPSCRFVLNDTLGKRINFLSDVLSEIKLSNVELVKARIEDFAHDKRYREKFDFVFSRGVSRISVLSEYSLPLVSVNGKMIAFKMDNCDEELSEGANAIKVLGGKFHVKHSYSIIEGEPERCLIEISKDKKSPNQYPRKAGTPSKNPL